MDYYNILGISRNSGASDIKKAYYKLAKEWHPDKHKGSDKEEAEKKFKEISQAYEILSNEESKKVYDMYGNDGLKRHYQQAGSGDIPDIFAQMFKRGFSSFDFNFNQNNQSPPIEHKMNVPLKYFYTGKNLDFIVKALQGCVECNGQGCKNTSDVSRCSKCNGCGRIVQIFSIAPGITSQQQSICPDCAGKGEAIASDKRCAVCNGKKKVFIDKKIDFYIKPGSDYGKYILSTGETNVFLYLLPIENEQYKRRGEHLFYEHEISLAESLLGFNHFIEYLDSSKKNIESNKIITTGNVKILKGLGMPHLDNTSIFGDLYICFNVKFPTHISNEQVNLLEKCFEYTFNTDSIKDKINIDNCKSIQSTQSIDINPQKQHGQEHASGVQCAQQ